MHPYYGLWDDTLNGGAGGFVKTKKGKIIRGTGQQTMAWISQNANKLASLPAIPTFKSSYPKKLRQKLAWIRSKYSSVRKAADGGIEDAKALAEAAYNRGSGHVGARVGQNDKYAIYFDEGPFSWVFRPNGQFWGVRNNN